jgi:hypothetical protein
MLNKDIVTVTSHLDFFLLARKSACKRTLHLTDHKQATYSVVDDYEPSRSRRFPIAVQA